MQILFSCTVNPETEEAIFTGNVDPQIALQILQNIVISEAVKRAKEEPKNKPEPEVTK